MRWWGPRGFTTPAGKMDVRPDGGWRVCMRSPDGDLRWLQCAYREIVEPERLAFTWAWEDRAGEPGHETLVTVNFAEQAGKTRLIVHQAAFEPATREGPEDDRDDWEQRLDRLDALLHDLPAAEPREPPTQPGAATAAPSPAARRGWSSPASSMRRAASSSRSGPSPSTSRAGGGRRASRSCPARPTSAPGGTWVRCMRAPEGTKYIKRGIYREIVEPERLVFTYIDEDAQGRRGHETLVTVTFEEEGGKTRLTLRQTGFEVARRRRTPTRAAGSAAWIASPNISPTSETCPVARGS